MKSWQQAAADAVIPGVLAALAVGATVAARGRADSGSAVAPINASSHALWGEAAAAVERITGKHTLPGLLINGGSAMWWALVNEKLFGAAMDRRRDLPTALLSGGTTAALAAVVDYALMPRRLTPGWERRVSPRSVALGLAAMGVGMAAGALLRTREAREPEGDYPFNYY